MRGWRCTGCSEKIALQGIRVSGQRFAGGAGLQSGSDGAVYGAATPRALKGGPGVPPGHILQALSRARAAAPSQKQRARPPEGGERPKGGGINRGERSELRLGRA